MKAKLKKGTTYQEVSDGRLTVSVWGEVTSIKYNVEVKAYMAMVGNGNAFLWADEIENNTDLPIIKEL